MSRRSYKGSRSRTRAEDFAAENVVENIRVVLTVEVFEPGKALLDIDFLDIYQQLPEADREFYFREFERWQQSRLMGKRFRRHPEDTEQRRQRVRAYAATVIG